MADPNIQGSEPGQIEPATNEPGAGPTGVPTLETIVPYAIHRTIIQQPIIHRTIGS